VGRSLQVFGDCEISCETTQVTRNTGPECPRYKKSGLRQKSPSECLH
jgi:hypothetical protein